MSGTRLDRSNVRSELTRTSRMALRSIALVEVAKALIALMAATGIVLHEQLRPIVDRLSAHLHLNPASGRPLTILNALRAEASAHLRLLALGVLIYAAIRLAEAVGLWLGKAWAFWLGALSAAIYLPFEIVELVKHPGALTATLLALNVAVAAYLTYRLVARRAEA